MNPLLALNSVRFTYRGCATPALDGVSLHVDSGEFVGVAGPTGSGKSTLVYAASGIVPNFLQGAFAGNVRLNDEPIAGRRVAELAGRIGTVFQDFESQLFSTNARLECAFGMENLGLDRATMRRRIERVAAQVGIEDLLDREPQSLSGGQKQRLALAGVLCLKPGVLLCDEPTTDLDPAGRRALFEALSSFARESHGVVLVEHETERLVHADRMVILDHGRIVSEGQPAEVLADPDACLRLGVYAPAMFTLAARLGLEVRPLTVEEAHRELRRLGWTPGPEVWADAATPGGRPLIEVESLSFAYVPGAPVLSEINLAVHRGEYIALIGANGSGKSTLVQHLNALLASRQGRVTYDGTPVIELGTARMGARVGFVFQSPDHMLFAARAYDDVAFGLRNRGMDEATVARQVAGALDQVGLLARQFDDPFVMTRGERQKLAVACVLACDPEVLILDEPTTGLDAREQESMMALLGRLNRAGRTLIIVTHALDVVAAHARRIVLLHEGRIVADGPTRIVLHDTARMTRSKMTAPPCVRLAGLLGTQALTANELAGLLRKDAR